MSSLPGVLMLGASCWRRLPADADDPRTARAADRLAKLLAPVRRCASRPAPSAPKTRSLSFQLPSARPLAADYIGPKSLRQQLDGGLAQPTALTADDFDEDGVPDLVSGYTGADGGLLTLHRGNVDAIYAHSPEARLRKATGNVHRRAVPDTGADLRSTRGAGLPRRGRFRQRRSPRRRGRRPRRLEPLPVPGRRPRRPGCRDGRWRSRARSRR